MTQDGGSSSAVFIKHIVPGGACARDGVIQVRKGSKNPYTSQCWVFGLGFRVFGLGFGVWHPPRNHWRRKFYHFCWKFAITVGRLFCLPSLRLHLHQLILTLLVSMSLFLSTSHLLPPSPSPSPPPPPSLPLSPPFQLNLRKRIPPPPPQVGDGIFPKP